MKGTTRKIIGHYEGFLNFLDPLLKNWLPLRKNVLTQLAKSVLIPLGSREATSASHAIIQ